MGLGLHNEEHPVPDEEAAEREKLRPNPETEMEMTKIPIKTRDASDYPVTVIPGHNDPLLKVHHLRYLLLGFNFIITLLGVVLLALSVWIYIDPAFWEYETTLNVDNMKTVIIMFIVAAVIILIIGFLGCFGAVSERRWLLILYIIIFGLIFLMEIAAVVLMWTAPYSKTISRELEKQIQKQIDDRFDDDSARRFMDFIQENLECCGATNARDYKTEAPNSCQDNDTGNLYEVGCASRMLSYIRSKSGIIGGIALPLLLVQLLGLLAAGCLIKSLEVESKYFM